MKLLFDQNLSFRLVAALADLYPGSVHVRDLEFTRVDDEVVWNYARQHGLVIVSKDTDFYYRSILRGQPPKVVWIRLGNCRTRQIQALLHKRHADLLAFEQDADATFVALS